MTSTKRELTFSHNQKLARHGWLRLTPAYSVQAVQQILTNLPGVSSILDPFSGTGTTGLVAAERGLRCDLLDINPFLVWFAEVKTANYGTGDLEQARDAAAAISEISPVHTEDQNVWLPPIHNIDRWWPPHYLRGLAHIYQEIVVRFPSRTPARDLLLVAFCRLIIETSNAAFNHQSMSFKNGNQRQLWETDAYCDACHRFQELAADILRGAQQRVSGQVRVICGDARQMPMPSGHKYDCVITSPPYPNRMSYIRELRPYMYWLGYLQEASEAGELDWNAVGGTWGVATSRLQNWQSSGIHLPSVGIEALVAQIALRSPLLANYIHRYFADIWLHLQNLSPFLAPKANLFYIVGNSKFYDTLVPVEKIYASLLAEAGFDRIAVEVLRKRNSKKELFEYMVSAIKPG